MNTWKYLFFFLVIILSGNTILAQGIITTIAGNGITQYIGDGAPATNFSLGGPAGICLDKKGNIYIANLYTARISKLAHDTLSTIVDTSGESGYTGNGGRADTATITNPNSICMDTAGNLYITDLFYHVVRKVSVSGIITTICGAGSSGFSGDGGPGLLATMDRPHGVCTDRVGNLYIADYGNHRIRKMNFRTGTITTVAGTGVNGFSGENGAAASMDLSFPNSICSDAGGNIYFSEYGNNRVRRIDAATGQLNTVAGNGSHAFAGDGDLAINASLNQPNSVFIDNKGYLYIADNGNNVVRVVTPLGIILTVAGNGIYDYTGDGGLAHNASFKGLTSVCVDNTGNIYIADGDVSVVRKVTPISYANVGVAQVSSSALNIYPNPSSEGKFTIRLASEQTGAGITVFNNIGRCIYTNVFSGKQAEINLAGKAPGSYYVQVSSSKGIATRKVVVR
jgi:sugar lactone lactonase YvrE